MSLLMAVILLAACRSGSEDIPGGGNQDCYLLIYVYAPGRPIVTRVDTNLKTATEQESKIHKLQLWVFKHDTGEKVGYLEEDDVTLDASGSTFRMVISREFADSPENVDVYALANVTTANSGHSFSAGTTRTELETAKLEGNYFGVATPIQAVPADGLPMTAVLKDKPIAGTFPALRVGTESMMETLLLTRTVSKVRFVLCREKESEPPVPSHQLKAITSIALDPSLIPSQSYLMLEEPFDNSLNPAQPLGPSRIHIVTGAHESTSLNFGAIADPTTIPETPAPDSPEKWIYSDAVYGNRTDYSAALDQGILNGELLEFGVTYVRESDKKLTGNITYTVRSDAEGVERVTPFEMHQAGDFTRNHIWTVLVMFEGGQLKVINVVDIGITSWITGDPDEHDLYNW